MLPPGRAVTHPVVAALLLPGFLAGVCRSGYGAGHPPVTRDLHRQHHRHEIELHELFQAGHSFVAGVCLHRIPDRHTR